MGQETPNALTPHPWLAAPIRRHDFHDYPAPVSVVGTHGGAGTSTVARLLSAPDLGCRSPASDDGHPPRFLLVARTNATGLMAASRALAAYCSGEHPEGPYLIGFVLVPDTPGRLPKPLKRRITILASAVPIHELPWVRAWRLDPTTEQDAIAAGLRRFAEQASLINTPALLEGETT